MANGAMQKMLTENKLLTFFENLESVNYYAKPCTVKTVWKSPIRVSFMVQAYKNQACNRVPKTSNQMRTQQML